MACQGINSWTFAGLVGAFVNLTVAYLLLCASAVVFVASKFLGFLGLSLPCDCNGLQALLVDSPRKTVSSVMVSVKRSSPFNSFYQEDYSLNLRLISDGKEEMVGGVEIEDDSIGNGNGNENGNNTPLEIGEISADSSYIFSSTDIGSCWDQKEVNSKSAMEDEEEEEGDDEKQKIRRLERALEEERASRAALYAELEKERIAASTAAEEAMAMIFRLQEEKALREMEGRQYRRMVEEKSAYEEEEMKILKEIILARERDKLFLEKEVQAYREVEAAATSEIHES